MKRQGTDRTHNIPKQYNHRTDWVLDSPSTVVWIGEIDSNKLNMEITHTTLSGTSSVNIKSNEIHD